MKSAIYLVLSVCLSANLQAQVVEADSKPPLDTSVYSNWLSVDNPQISNDGNYVAYKVQRGTGFSRNPGSLRIKSIKTGKELEIDDPASTAFSADSKMLFCLTHEDVLNIADLAVGAISRIKHVGSFKLFTQGSTQWLASESDSTDKTLTVQSLTTGYQKVFYGVDDYLITPNGAAIILKTGSAPSFTLNWASVADSSQIQIWAGADPKAKILNFLLDTSGTQLAFLVENGNGEKAISIYDKASAKISQVFNSRRDRLPAGFDLKGITNFSLDRTRLFISLHKEMEKSGDLPIVPLEVWNYQDALLQGVQAKRAGRPNDLAAIIVLSDHHVFLLQNENERPVDISGPSDDYVLMDAAQGDYSDLFWSRESQPSVYLVSTITGARKHLSLTPSELSPDGRYLICRDIKTSELYSYEISSGKIINISSAIDAPYIVPSLSSRKVKECLEGGWLGQFGHLLLVYDTFDIWEVDLSKTGHPLNLTNGYGRRHHIAFRPGQYSPQSYTRDFLTVLAFDKIKKTSGFYRIDLAHNRDPELLTMGSCLYYHSYGMMPIKAQGATAYFIQKEDATHSPNYFWTEDFKNFTPVSDVYPEKKYNWLTSELAQYKMGDGTMEDAVIYKPEDFNPGRKYPVIMTYYEERSDFLHRYFPGFMDGYNFNLPWFVSHGYVVVVPDIKYEIGKPGASALKYVLGTADYIRTFAWADSRHIGLCGHSFGGFETNYIIAHSGRFAAAISNSGTSDEILEYLSLWNGGADKIYYTEEGQGRMGKSLWEDPARYLEKSPLLSANKIITPLLTVANREDGNVSYLNGQELFLAMRRLGKRIWMLQYDKQSHGVWGKGYIDYTLRSQQFFDFYLKGTAAPVWMVEGIPAAKKQTESGLELEPIGKIPGPGLLTPEEHKKVDMLQNRKPVTVTIP